MNDTITPVELGETKKAALRLSAQMSSASIIGMVVGYPIRAVIAAALGPSGYGVLNMADLVQKYSAYADLGMKYSLSRQIPILKGRGDEEEIHLVSTIVLSWFIIISAIAVIVLWTVYAFGYSFKGLLTLPNIVLISLIIMTDRLNTYYHNYVKGIGLFDAVGINSFITTVIGPLVIVGLVMWMQVTGVLLGRLIISLLSGANYLRFIMRYGGLHVRLMLPFAKTFELLKLGLLLYANTLSEGMLETITLTLLAIYVGVDLVGQFGYAVSMVIFGTGITTGVNLVISRRMLYDRGVQGARLDYTYFRPYMEGLLIVYLMFVSIALGLTYFGHEVVVRLFISKFTPAIFLAQIVAFGQMGCAITYLFRTYFNVTDQLLNRLALVWGGLVITVVSNLVFLSLGYGALGAALGIAVGYCAYAVLLVVASARQIYGSTANGVGLLSKLLLISLLLVICLHLLTTWQPAWTSAPNQFLLWCFEFGVAALRLVIYTVIVLLLYSLIFRQYRPEHEVWTVLMYVISAFKQRLQLRTVTS